MKLSIINAIEAPFVDKKWYIKLTFPCIVLCLLSVMINEKTYIHKLSVYIHYPLIIFFLISLLILGIICSGFFIQIRHNFICDIKQYPDFKGHIGGYFLNGFNSSMIFLAYTFVAKLLGLIFNIPTNGFISLTLGIFLLYAYVVLLVLGSFSQNAYADSFYFSKAFDYKKIFSLVPKVKKEIFIYFVFFFVSILCCISILVPAALIGRHLHIKTSYFMALLYPIISFIFVVLGLILYNLQAQIYNIAKFKLKNNEQVFVK